MPEKRTIAMVESGIIAEAAQGVHRGGLVPGTDHLLGSQKPLFGDISLGRAVHGGAEEIKQIIGRDKQRLGNLFDAGDGKQMVVDILQSLGQDGGDCLRTLDGVVGAEL